ncbi:sulfatase [Ningiella sp. W23]|uniref:sulfatase family protein n=1 Tax=Ningiella sp. W23 TaxID=3023715 RepID=UPI0037564057
MKSFIRINIQYLYGFAVCILAASFTVLVPKAHAQEQAQKHSAQIKPNIVWIVSEDNSPLLGSYGDTLANTPNLDALAKSGIQFDQVFSPAPVCAPTRNAIITGMYASSLGTENMRSQYPLPSFVRFFPAYLKEAGYHTSNRAKTDYNTPWQDNAWDESNEEASYLNRDDKQAFFHVRNIFVSHESSLHERIASEDIIKMAEQVKVPLYHPDIPEVRADWAQYYNRVSEMDRQVGLVIDELKQNGVFENSIIFYYSDHGGALGRSKRFLYDSGMHVPLIVHIPDSLAHLRPKNINTNQMITLADAGPTALSLAGIQPPEYMQGRAFLGEYAAENKAYAHGYRARMDERFDLARSVRDDRYVYIRHYLPHLPDGQFLQYLWRSASMQAWDEKRQAGELNNTQRAFFMPKSGELLFDRVNDPDNVINLAGKPEYAEQLARMRAENIKWMKETKDAGLIPEVTKWELARLNISVYDYVRSDAVDYEEEFTWFQEASLEPQKEAVLLNMLTGSSSIKQYWALMSLVTYPQSMSAKILEQTELLVLSVDEAVRLVAIEALLAQGSQRMHSDYLDIAYKHTTSGNAIARLYALNLIDRFSEGEKRLELVDLLRKTLDTSDTNAEREDYERSIIQSMIDR